MLCGSESECGGVCSLLIRRTCKQADWNWQMDYIQTNHTYSSLNNKAEPPPPSIQTDDDFKKMKTLYVYDLLLETLIK